MLKPGGILVYSTCTFAPLENEGTIARFLQTHPDYEVEPIPHREGFAAGDTAWGLGNIHSDYEVEPIPHREGFAAGNPAWGPGDVSGFHLERTVRLFPHKVRGEGHFIAKLRKKDTAAGGSAGNAGQLDRISRSVRDTAAGGSAGNAWQLDRMSRSVRDTVAGGSAGNRAAKQTTKGKPHTKASWQKADTAEFEKFAARYFKRDITRSGTQHRDKDITQSGANPREADITRSGTNPREADITRSGACSCEADITRSGTQHRDKDIAQSGARHREKDSVPENIVSFGSHLYLVPPELLSIPVSGLHIVRAGLELGENKKGRFEPSHALALALGPEDVSASFELGGMAERYLRGEVLPYSGGNGWVLMCINGVSLGWGKAVNGQLKNHYPKGLRR